MKPVYITAAGAFLPNAPVDNTQIEQFLGLVGGKPSRLKDRILKQNGIKTRHYALGPDGTTTHLNEELAAHAALEALAQRGLRMDDVEMLACGTTMGDAAVPGFASMVHGRLGGRPIEILSAAGVCCAGMQAFQGAVRAVQTGARKNAVVVGSEMVSRFLKASRFETTEEEDLKEKELGYRAFDADFLRWMLSDGAGAWLLESRPRPDGLSLRVDWVEVVSYANERPVCMYAGLVDKDQPKAGNSWLDFPTVAAADRAGVTKLRQDTKLLPDIVRLGVEEYLRLVRRERLHPERIDHVLCHYSSHFFKGEIMKLLEEARVAVPEPKWFSNLYTKGNTGAASIFIMLEEALRTGLFKKGESIALMVPESGRFTVSFAKLTVVDAAMEEVGSDAAPTEARASDEHRRRRTGVSARPLPARDDNSVKAALLASPLGAGFDDEGDALLRHVGVELALVWTDFERMLREVPIVKRLDGGDATVEDYKRLLVNLRQQVMEGARWIARAASNISIELFAYRSLFLQHAGEEHRDYQMLERDYVAVGGSHEDIVRQKKNVGSEALSAFMFHQASQPDPLDLLGAMFVIEGLGTKKAARWAEQLRANLGLTPQQTSFLSYHGKNDDNHFNKLRDTIKSGLLDAAAAERIIKTAKVTARLYALQLEEIDNV